MANTTRQAQRGLRRTAAILGWLSAVSRGRGASYAARSLTYRGVNRATTRALRKLR